MQTEATLETPSEAASLSLPQEVSVPQSSRAGIVNAFTVDVEDYYHVSAFASTVPRERWDDYESRVVASTERMLRLLDRHGVRGTFFILGWVADRHPQLVRTIRQCGHGIGCHSYWHRLIYDLTPEEFAADLAQALDAIGSITGEKVRSYRAPSFSITRRSLWALPILAEHGIRIDSSIYPIHHDRYGIPGAERFPHRVSEAGGELCEFPPSIHRTLGMSVPVAGGGYFRLYPFALTRRWMRALNDRERQPAMFYIHPWEIDPDQPRLPGSLRSRFRHYQNLRTTEDKLERLLGSFTFGTIEESLESRRATS